MGGLAFVFSGQGDQRPGMGKDLYLSNRTAAKVMDQFESVRTGTLRQCFEGEREELRNTANAQPCLYVFAAAVALSERGILPDAVAGFSLGEIPAAAFAGVFDAETGFRLVCKRGELMAQAATEAPSCMAAVLGLGRDEVEELCAQFDEVFPANYNGPGQVAVSASEGQMSAFKAYAEDNGARVVALKVQGGFHSPYMESAARGFAAELQKVVFNKPSIPVYSNVTSLPYGDAGSLLAQQICAPVRWEETIRNMIADGIDSFIEVGPGKTLSNIVKRIDGGVSVSCVSDIVAAPGR